MDGSRSPVPGTPRVLRALNDRAALDALVTRGPLTTAALVELTGLSKPTASALLGRLEAAGLVAAAGTDAGARRGPNARLFAVAGGAGLVAGVDMGPRRAAVRLVDLAGRIVAQDDVALGAAGGGRGPAPDLRAALSQAVTAGGVRGRRLDGVVVGVQGGYDAIGDRLAFAAHLPGWSRPGLQAALAGAAGCPVTIENDVNLAAVAEQAARPDAVPPGCRAVLWMGDGLGLAFHVRGVLHRGAGGGAGEIGYIQVPEPAADVPPGPAVALQDLLGAGAVRRLARRHGLGSRTAADAVRLAVQDCTRTGGTDGQQGFVSELAARVGAGLAAVTAVLDPDQIVLCGPIGRAGGGLLADRVGAALHQLTPARPQVSCTVVPGNAVLAGACALAVDGLRDALFSASARTPAATTGAVPARVSR